MFLLIVRYDAVYLEMRMILWVTICLFSMEERTFSVPSNGNVYVEGMILMNEM